MYCAWPPSRHGGTTHRRAARLATSLPWSLRSRCRNTSTPEAAPAEVSTSPSSTNSTSGFRSTSGKRARNRSAACQCVVAGRPSSSPAAASTKAAVQMDTRRVPGRMRPSASAIGAGRSGRSGRNAPAGAKGATTTVSAPASASGPCSTAMVKSAAVRTGRLSTLQVSTSYRPSAAPRIRLGMPSSNGYTPSRARTTTRCAWAMARLRGPGPPGWQDPIGR